MKANILEYSPDLKVEKCQQQNCNVTFKEGDKVVYLNDEGHYILCKKHGLERVIRLVDALNSFALNIVMLKD